MKRIIKYTFCLGIILFSVSTVSIYVAMRWDAHDIDRGHYEDHTGTLFRLVGITLPHSLPNK